MLSCSCEWDGDGWYYIPRREFTITPIGRRKRCCSCKKLIGYLEECIQLDRFRDPLTDVEERIWGDSVQMAPWFLCEQCSEIYLNLDAIGYCYLAGEDLRANLKDYWDLTGFKPKGRGK